MNDFSVRTPIGARRAERFSRLLEDSPGPDGPVGGADTALLDVVESLRAVPHPEPRAHVAADLRERLMAEADEVLVPGDTRLVLPARGGRPARRATVAAAAFVLVGSSAGMAVASQGSVQGDPLYGLKRGLEGISASMSLSEAARGQDYLDQSRTRLGEVGQLLDAQDSPATEEAVRDTLGRFSASADQGSDLLLDSYRSGASAGDVASVRDFAEDAMRELRGQAEQAPARLQDSFSEAATALTDLDQQAREACAACGSDEALALPDVLMNASSTTSLDRLIDEGGTASAPAAPSRPAQATTGARTGGGRQASADTLGAQGSSGTTTSGAAGSTVTQTTKKVPTLVKLPGSQSGAPSVIDLDRTVKDVTSGVQKTTDGLVDGLSAATGGKRLSNLPGS